MSRPSEKNVELSPEELEVFKRCGEKWPPRGVLLGAVGCGAVYAFQRGRGSSLRFPKLTYALAFTIPFIYGGIYAPVRCVMKGIMGLEHSPLRDLIQQSMKNGKCKKNQQFGESKNLQETPSNDSSSTDSSKKTEYNKYGDKIEK